MQCIMLLCIIDLSKVKGEMMELEPSGPVVEACMEDSNEEEESASEGESVIEEEMVSSKNSTHMTVM